MPSRVSRRRWVKGAVALALVAAGGVFARVRTSGYDVPDEVRSRLAALAPWQYVLVQHLARRICAADRPGVVTPDETDVAGFVDGYVARMAPRMRRDLLRFFAVVEHVAPAFTGSASRFTHLAPDAQDRVLAALEAHASTLMRGGFEGVKALLFMGYYRDPRTWSVLGYDGPLVDRPAGGFW